MTKVGKEKMKKGVVREEIRRVIEEMKEYAKEDRMRMRIKRGDIGTDERNEVLLILRYLGYVIREKENEYIIYLDRQADTSMMLRVEQISISNDFLKAKDIRSLSKAYVKELIDEKVAIIETDIYIQKLGEDKKDYIVKKVPNDDELNKILIKELEELGYKVQETSSQILINAIE